MTISIVNYGVGNLGSLASAFSFLGANYEFVSTAAQISSATRVILPGVGAFPHAMEELKRKGLIEALQNVREREIPLLGICLGMQLLFYSGEEGGGAEGLGLLGGSVRKLNTRGRKLPHIGYSAIQFNSDAASRNPLLIGVNPEDSYYFVHSYRVVCEKEDNRFATCEYGEIFPAVVGEGNCYGVQFHPEKSRLPGLKILQNFLTF